MRLKRDSAHNIRIPIQFATRLLLPTREAIVVAWLLQAVKHVFTNRFLLPARSAPYRLPSCSCHHP